MTIVSKLELSVRKNVPLEAQTSPKSSDLRNCCCSVVEQQWLGVLTLKKYSSIQAFSGQEIIWFHLPASVYQAETVASQLIIWKSWALLVQAPPQIIRTQSRHSAKSQAFESVCHNSDRSERDAVARQSGIR